MRPGMPLGRKHFRRSRDAPIYYGKDCGQSLLSKIVCPETCLYLSRWRRLVNTLDDREHMGDSEGKSGKTYPGGTERAGRLDRGKDFCCNSLGLRL